MDRFDEIRALNEAVFGEERVIYRMDRTIDAADVASTLRRATFGESRGGISILSTVVPATVAYREAATATLDFVLREMRHPEGGFYSALDASSGRPDHPGEQAEGAYYLWRSAELRALLQPVQRAAERMRGGGRHD